MSQSLVSRWNATYPPGTPVTVASPGRPQFDAITSGEAGIEGGTVVVPIVSANMHNSVPPSALLSHVEHRVILDPATEQSLRALGMPPLSELDPEPLVNLRDIPRERWEEVDACWLEIPHSIAGYIAKLTAPPTEEQVERIERHVAEFHGLPPVVWHGGEPWLAAKEDLEKRRIGEAEGHFSPDSDLPIPPSALPRLRAQWYVQFTFAHRFIPGTAQRKVRREAQPCAFAHRFIPGTAQLCHLKELEA